MALEKYIPGSDINFSIKKRKPDDTYHDLDAMADIFIYVSNGSRVVKFSKNAKTGYTTLVRLAADEYIIQLSSAQTEYLGSGIIRIAQDFISTNVGLTDLRDNKKSGIPAFILESDKISIET